MPDGKERRSTPSAPARLWISIYRVSLHLLSSEVGVVWRCGACSAELAGGHERPTMGCPCCGAVGLWVAPVRRTASEVFAVAASTPWSAAAVARKSWVEEIEPITGIAWSAPALWLLTGPPGSGKTTLACKIAAECEGPVVLLSAEMPVGRALAR